AQLLHDGVVDRIGRAVLESRRVDAEKHAVTLALPVGALAAGEDVLAEIADRVDPHRRAHREDARVPEIVLRLEVLLRFRGVRLLDEGLDKKNVFVGYAPSGPDVSVARLGRGRRHAEGDDIALARERHTALDRALENVLLRDDVV